MSDISSILTRAPFTDAQRKKRWRALAAASGGGKVTPAIRLSGGYLTENSAVDTFIGTLSVSGVTGTPSFTLVDSSSSKTKLTGNNILAGASAVNYEVTPSFNIIVSVSGVTPAIANTTFTINVVDVDEVAPTITSSNAISLAENVALSHTLTANEPVVWTKTGGADTALFSLSGSTLSMTAKDFEAPADADTSNTYIVQVTATDLAGNATNQTITVTVTNVVDETAPTITSSASVSQAENAILNHTLTANETVTWTKTGGADAALFSLAGSTLTLPAQDFEAPADSGSNNTYVVQVTATDAASNATNQTITVTITNVSEGGGATLETPVVSLSAVSDTGTLLDNITTDATPDLDVFFPDGILEDDRVYVRIEGDIQNIDGVGYHEVTVGEAGGSDLTLTGLDDLVIGTNDIEVMYTRGATSSAWSAVLTLTIIDSLATPIVTLNAGSDTGTPGDDETEDTTPDLDVEFPDGILEDDRVYVRVDGVVANVDGIGYHEVTALEEGGDDLTLTGLGELDVDDHDIEIMYTRPGTGAESAWSAVLTLTIVAPPSGIDPATEAWIDAVVLDGGTVSPTQEGYIDTLVTTLKGGTNIWARLDRLWLFASGDVHQAKIDLIALATTATGGGSVTFTANTGIAADGVSSYTNTNYIPATHAVNATVNSSMFAIYNRTSDTAGGLKSDGIAGTTSWNWTGRYTDGNMYADVNTSSGALGANANFQGFYVFSRTGASTGAIYKNGNSTPVFTLSGTASALPTTKTFLVGAANNVSGAVYGVHSHQVAAVVFGAGLNATDATTLAAAINAYMTSLGTNIY